MTGGLMAGSWLYRVAAIKDPAMDPENPGGESLPSDEVVAILVSASTVSLTCMPVTGARAYRVYRTPMVNGTSGQEVMKLSSAVFVNDLEPTGQQEERPHRLGERLDRATRDRLERLRRNRSG